jgi:endonuclease/exonuclease/phosphatase family metal-dependent hydrolase
VPGAAGASRGSGGTSSTPIGTFNIKWFGFAGPEPRDESEIEQVAAVIRQIDAPLLGLQEINDEAIMERLVRYLPGYRFVLGTSGREQRCAILWDTKRASVGRAAEWADVNEGLSRSESSLRAPLVAQARVGNFDFLFVVVHLKAMMDEKSMRTRRTQLSRMRARLDEWVRNNPDKDVIAVGDFNDLPDSRAMAELTGGRGSGGAGFINTGSRLPDNVGTYLGASGRIDHIVVSSPAVSQEEWTGQAFVYPKPRGQERKLYEEAVSDHLPSWATFDTRRDNDP